MAGCAGCAAEVQLEDTFCPRCGAPVTRSVHRHGRRRALPHRQPHRHRRHGRRLPRRAHDDAARSRDQGPAPRARRQGGVRAPLRARGRVGEPPRPPQHHHRHRLRPHPRGLAVPGDGVPRRRVADPGDRGRADAARARARRSCARSCAGSTTPTPPASSTATSSPTTSCSIERDGQRDVVKILDFGIAKVTEPQSGREALTQAGVIFGTPEYLSPEQALGEAVDARADIYAAGVILYEMLAGRRPFESEDKVKIISMHLAHAPPRIRDVDPDGRRCRCRSSRPCCRRWRSRASTASRRRWRSCRRSTTPRRRRSARRRRRARRHGAAARPRQRPDRRGADPRPPSPGAGPTTALLGRRAARRRRRRRSSGRGHRAAALVAAPPRPAPPPPDLADRFKKVEGWLEEGNNAAARRALEQALDRAAQGRTRPLHARAGGLRRRPAPGGARRTTGRPSRSTPGFRGDPVLLAHVDALLAEPKEADAALDLVVDRIGAPAADLLEKVANEGSDLARRRRAAAALDEIGQGKRVDRVSLMMLELKKAQLLRRAQGPGREAARPRRSAGAARRCAGCAAAAWAPSAGAASDTSCMKTELPEAIKVLEKKAGVRANAEPGADGEAQHEERPATIPATCSPAWCWCSRCSSSTRSASCSRCRC